MFLMHEVMVFNLHIEFKNNDQFLWKTHCFAIFIFVFAVGFFYSQKLGGERRTNFGG